MKGVEVLKLYDVTSKFLRVFQLDRTLLQSFLSIGKTIVQFAIEGFL